MRLLTLRKWHLSRFSVCLLALLCVLCAKAYAQQTSPAAQGPPAGAEIPAAQLLQPAELARILRSSGGEKPLILQIGSHVLYAEAHVPGSEYVGATGQDSGLQALRERVKTLPRDRFVVIYCGCCPWIKCPNIRPAYQQLVSLGFTRVKALYLADNFGTNWVAQGYPVAKGR
jgi:thiosulfate/3-mercaptopyruvate sulfurtransferase